MGNKAPEIDQRTATDIARHVQDLLKIYTPAWKEFDPDTGQPEGVGAALIRIFSRFTEIIIQRLNQAPQKNFLAFLNLLGASLLPPQPARVPVTFSLAAGSAADGVVPAGTQVAAPPAEGEKEPVIFETERELVVTSAQLASVFVRDPDQDMYADHSSIVTSEVLPGVPTFQGNRRIGHILYLGHNRLLGFPQIEKLYLKFTLSDDLQDERELKWELWDGSKWQEKKPITDQTDNLTKSGTGTIDLDGIEPVPSSPMNFMENRWLRCRLMTPITPSTEALLCMVRESQLPTVSQVEMEVKLYRPVSEGLKPEMAFTNSVPIDLGKDFFPFGEKPKPNDILYLASAEAFSKDRAQNLASTGATIELEIQVANSHLLQAETCVRPSDDLQVDWECWDGVTWQRVGSSTAPFWLSLLELDTLPSFTTEASVVVQGSGQKGTNVIIETPGDKPKTVLIDENGRFAEEVSLWTGLNVITFTVSNDQINRMWAVIFRGTREERKIWIDVEAPDLPVPEDLIKLEVTVQGEDAQLIRELRVTNGRNDEPVKRPKGEPLPIPLAEGRNELLIEGLGEDQDEGPPILAATTLMISRVADPPDPDAKTGFSDGTYAFCQSGTVTLRLPDTVAKKRVVNGQENYWLRTRLVKGDYGKEAVYKLKNPLKPEEGFVLIPAGFRPPILSDVKIGYSQTLSGVPEVCLYNNLAFEHLKQTNNAQSSSFKPFRPAPVNRATLCLGFTLPPNRKIFPHSTISLFNRVADFKYGERSVPVSPNRSKKSSDPGSEIIHKFIITNTAPTAASLKLTVLGTRWPTTVIPQQMDLPAGESQEVMVEVTIPPDTPLSNSDRGFMRLTTADPTFEHSASFVTRAGMPFPSGERLQLSWQYWNGTTWAKLTVRDESDNFTRTGLIQFIVPSDFTSHKEFGLVRWWLRVQWEKGEYDIEPRLCRMLLNTTMAVQMITIRNEILGSSDAGENQKFRTTRTPVLLGQKLEVREPEMPSAEEQMVIKKEEGEDAVSCTFDAGGRPRDIWVRWHEVSDFYGSGVRDRHYVLDHITGEIRFGDGLNGLIPPVGNGNLRIASYQTGGGTKGNKPAGSIIQLKTTVPYVDKVINTEPAKGGADAEPLDLLIERAPKTIRHHGRGVTLEDYEDLAMLASPEVARTKCVPLRNLVDDPLDMKPIVPGEVSIIIVPRSTEAKPLPGRELIGRVRKYLETNGVPTAKVSVVGPLYVSVNLTAEIALASPEGASAVEQVVYKKLGRFLHPLTGGLDGNGWTFGRRPHKSDFYALIEAVPGVDHVRILKIVEIEDQPDIKKTGRFLVYSGKHSISLLFGE